MRSKFIHISLVPDPLHKHTNSCTCKPVRKRVVLSKVSEIMLSAPKCKYIIWFIVAVNYSITLILKRKKECIIVQIIEKKGLG